MPYPKEVTPFSQLEDKADETLRFERELRAWGKVLQHYYRAYRRKCRIHHGEMGQGCVGRVMVFIVCSKVTFRRFYLFIMYLCL